MYVAVKLREERKVSQLQRPAIEEVSNGVKRRDKIA
jgi:hypothetical protein